VPRRNKRAARVKLPRRQVVAAGRCWLTKKYGYSTEDQALQALSDVREKRLARGQTKVENRVYFHEVCELWHLTHETEAELARRREEYGSAPGAE
jgi:hypothetical protein